MKGMYNVGMLVDVFGWNDLFWCMNAIISVSVLGLCSYILGSSCTL